MLVESFIVIAISLLAYYHMRLRFISSNHYYCLLVTGYGVYTFIVDSSACKATCSLPFNFIVGYLMTMPAVRIITNNNNHIYCLALTRLIASGLSAFLHWFFFIGRPPASAPVHSAVGYDYGNRIILLFYLTAINYMIAYRQLQGQTNSPIAHEASTMRLLSYSMGSLDELPRCMGSISLLQKKKRKKMKK